jgi:hypothetical protein
VAGERPAPLDLSRPRRYGELLQASLHIFGRHADVLFTLALVLVAPVTLVVDGLWGRALADGVDADPSRVSQGVSAALSVFVILPLVIAATALAVRDLGGGTPPANVGATLRSGLERFPAVFGAVVLYTVACLAGFVLLVVPGVWLAIRCYFAAQAAAVDGLGPAAAMRRSSDLVRGHWWRTCGCLVATGLMLGLVGSIATNAFATSGSGALFVAGAAIVESVVVSITAIFAALLFFDLRARATTARVDTMAE